MSDRQSPIPYSEQLGKKICDLMAGGYSLKEICDLPGYPDRTTVWRWTCKHVDFREQLSQAREAHADVIADEVVYIADNEVDPQKARNRIEARKWKAGVIKPREYGPKMDVNITDAVDWDKAHRDARARQIKGELQRSISDQSAPIDVQPIEDAQLIDHKPTDKQSVDALPKLSDDELLK